MRIQTRIVSAVLLVVAAMNVVYALYVIKMERQSEMARLLSVIEENDRLLKVVAAGPLYDGNVEQLDAILDSLFANRDIIHIELTEFSGNIKMYRARTPLSTHAESITRRVVITRGIDELGEIRITYSTVRIEQLFRASAMRLAFFAFVMLLMLSGVIYLVARGISGPIERLTESAKAMASGHLTQEISTSGAQELQSLGQSFIRMRDSIREKVEALEAQNTALRLKDLAITSSVNGIAIADPSGLLTYVNPSFLRIWGYDDPSQVLGRLAMDFWQDQEQAARIIKHLHEHGTVSGELIAKRKDGSSFPVELSANLMTDETGKPSYLIGFFIDITERKRIEETLRDSRNLLQTVLDTIPVRVFWKDLNLRYLGCNRPFAFDAGVQSPEEMTGKDDYQMGWHEQADLYRSDDRQVLETGNPKIQYEEPQTTPDGRRIWLRTSKVPLKNAEGRILGVLGTYDDITEYKQAEASLRQAALIIENSPVMLFRWKEEEGWPIVLVSQNVIQLGYTPEELLGGSVPFSSIVYPDDLERVGREVQTYTASGLERFQQEYRVVTKDGQIRWVDDRTVVERDDAGRVTHYQGIVVDITERKRAEEERVRLESQLLQAQKMESVGRLAGGVAHDFNNMLSVILGYAELIKSRIPEGDPLSKDAEEIQRAAIRSRDITRQLLAFSRQQIIAPRNVSLNTLITDTQKTLARLIGEDIELRFFPGEGLWIIRLDPSQIDQILINLAVNARDAMPDGGKLTIETANVHLDDAYCRDHAGPAPGDYVQLVVSDNGVGMDRETLSHVFEPFFTTKEVDKGTGLGLATVYGIVRQNNGFIHVYSERGQGTTFRIYFPRIIVKEHEITEGEREAGTAPGTGTILLVEDDEMVRAVATALLQNIGYTVLVERTPMGALFLLEKTDTPVDLLLTDVVMPGMKGTELRDRARVIRPGIKVLFMSGYTTNVIVHHGVLEEGVHFVQKPFSRESLAQKVKEAMNG